MSNRLLTKYQLLILLLAGCVAYAACSKSEEDPNYVRTKTSLAKDGQTGLTGGLAKMLDDDWGEQYCPSGQISCVTGGAIPCQVEVKCNPANIPLYKNYPCAQFSQTGCGVVSAGASCSFPFYCIPKNGPTPTHSTTPCSFGSIPMGCFNVTGGPDCSPLVNCQTPPP